MGDMALDRLGPDGPEDPTVIVRQGKPMGDDRWRCADHVEMVTGLARIEVHVQYLVAAEKRREEWDKLNGNRSLDKTERRYERKIGEVKEQDARESKQETSIGKLLIWVSLLSAAFGGGIGALISHLVK